jgi:alanine racemase
VRSTPGVALERPRPTVAVVDLDAIASNDRLLRERAGGREVWAVVKADAYGHGAVPVALRLEREGARRFAVALIEEAIALRRGGVRGEILVLSTGDARQAPLYRAYGVTASLHDLALARSWARATDSFAPPLPVHLKIDSGMGRLGVRAEAIAPLASLLREAKGLRVTGVFTQLASGEDEARDPTRSQVEALRSAVAGLGAAGIMAGVVHAANSGGLLAHPETFFDAVRPGLALYGVSPSERLALPGLSPAMSLETRVLAVKEVPAGTPLGYGGAFVTRRASRIAVLPIGYDDGYRRSFSGKVSALLSGGRAPVVGVVSMDLTLVDATESGAAPGDRAVLLGRLGGDAVTAWDLARGDGTVPYEILCGISSRVPRLYRTPDATD